MLDKEILDKLRDECLSAEARAMGWDEEEVDEEESENGDY